MPLTKVAQSLESRTPFRERKQKKIVSFSMKPNFVIAEKSRYQIFLSCGAESSHQDPSQKGSLLEKMENWDFYTSRLVTASRR